MDMQRIIRALGAAALCAILTAAAGCPASTEKPGAEKSAAQEAGVVKPPVSAAKSPTIDPQSAAPQMPAAEFQQPPVLPGTEPLPKLAEEPAPLPAEPAAPLEPVVTKTKQPDTSQPKPPAEPQPKRDTVLPKDLPFDPIAVNGPIFVGWTKPKLAIVITGMEEGYIEPCGCAGLDRMKGGMSRRDTFIEGLRKKGWPVAALDVGGIARGFGRQAELKFQTMVEGKRKMGYDAIGFGVSDLHLPAGEVVSVAAGVNGQPSPFVSANVGLFGFDSGITPTSRVIEAGGVRLGVTAVLGLTYQKEIHNDEIEMRDPAEALKKIVPELKKKSDYMVLLANATKDESIALGRKFPGFNVVVTSDGPPIPPKTPETIKGAKTTLITVGQKGMDAIVLGLYGGGEVRYQRVPLDSRFPQSKDMKMLMAAYQDQLKVIGFDGLGFRPVPSPLAKTNGRYIGSEKCKSCHEESYDVWRRSKHAQAYKTLADLDPPRNFDPDCVSCHVVGWDPTKYFLPYKSGFVSLKKTPQLINTGCEDCHGPGQFHYDAEQGSDEKLQEQYRKAVVISKEESKKSQCVTCHDLDNSPDFDFDTYYPKIEHHEDEE